MDCDLRFVTIERYLKPKPGPRPGQTRRSINYGQKGEDNPSAILTDRDVYAIRKAYDDGLTYSQVKRRFGITSSSYYRIGKRTQWSHLPERTIDDGRPAA